MHSFSVYRYDTRLYKKKTGQCLPNLEGTRLIQPCCNEKEKRGISPTLNGKKERYEIETYFVSIIMRMISSKSLSKESSSSPFV